jgi:hypothetical protein
MHSTSTILDTVILQQKKIKKLQNQNRKNLLKK